METIRKSIIIATTILCTTGNTGSTAAGTVENNNVHSDRIISAINTYRNREGFDVLFVGSFGTYFLKKAVKIGMSEESEKIVDTVKGIKKILLVDFSGCDSIVRKDFILKMDGILANYTLLMETKDENENMFMYGITGNEESSIRDFVLYSPKRGNVICLFGTISLDIISKTVE